MEGACLFAGAVFIFAALGGGGESHRARAGRPCHGVHGVLLRADADDEGDGEGGGGAWGEMFGKPGTADGVRDGDVSELCGEGESGGGLGVQIDLHGWAGV